MSSDDEFGPDESPDESTDETTTDEGTDEPTDVSSEGSSDGSTDETSGTDESTDSGSEADTSSAEEPADDTSGTDDTSEPTDTFGTDESTGSGSEADASSTDEVVDDTAGTDTSEPVDDPSFTDEPTDDTSTSDDASSSDQPTDDTSETVAAGSDQPTDDSSGTDTSEPVNDSSGTDTSGTDMSGDETSGTETSGTDTSGTDTSGTETSGTETSATAAAGTEQGPPYLIADLYPGDAGARPAWEKVVAAPNFVGVILKAWNGERYNDGGWFAANWPRVKAAGGDRYGTSWFRGSYLFLKFAYDGTKQANAYLDAIDKAGGWENGDIIPAVDVEWDTYPPINKNSSTQQIVDCVSTCNQRIHERTGKKIMLYGRTVLSDRKITDHLNGDLIWNPSYTPHPWHEGIETWDEEAMVLWQYAGDNKGVLPGHPSSVPGIRQCDVSVFTKGAQHTTLRMLRDTLL